VRPVRPTPDAESFIVAYIGLCMMVSGGAIAIASFRDGTPEVVLIVFAFVTMGLAAGVIIMLAVSGWFL
jgi:hypothetical protein